MNTPQKPFNDKPLICCKGLTSLAKPLHSCFAKIGLQKPTFPKLMQECTFAYKEITTISLQNEPCSAMVKCLWLYTKGSMVNALYCHTTIRIVPHHHPYNATSSFLQCHARSYCHMAHPYRPCQHLYFPVSYLYSPC
jgi:hypothetical protein